jgi:hypothetical protein
MDHGEFPICSERPNVDAETLISVALFAFQTRSAGACLLTNVPEPLSVAIAVLGGIGMLTTRRRLI